MEVKDVEVSRRWGNSGALRAKSPKMYAVKTCLTLCFGSPYPLPFFLGRAEIPRGPALCMLVVIYKNLSCFMKIINDCCRVFKYFLLE